MPELKLSTAKKEIPAIHQDEKTKKKEWLAEEIMIEFYNLEEAGVPLVFSYGSTKRPEKFTLLHGGKYKLRREVINHIESRQTKLWNWKPDGTGRLTKSLNGFKSRFQCRQVFDQ